MKKKTIWIAVIVLLIFTVGLGSIYKYANFFRNVDESILEQQDEIESEVVFLDLIGRFGFADWNEATDDAQRIIVSEYPDAENYDKNAYNPVDFKVAIGKGGTVTGIAFSNWQNETPENNDRDTAGNFNNLAGNVFKKTTGHLEMSQTYFLTKESFKNSLIPFKTSPKIWDENRDSVYFEFSHGMPVDSATVEKVETFKNRKIVDSELLAETETGEKICLFVFERVYGDKAISEQTIYGEKKRDMLSSLVYIAGDRIIYKDYLATYDDTSTWRVDAGHDPGVFDILFIAHANAGLIIGVTWGAPESEGAFVLLEKDGVFVETQFNNSRYWAPI